MSSKPTTSFFEAETVWIKELTRNTNYTNDFFFQYIQILKRNTFCTAYDMMLTGAECEILAEALLGSYHNVDTYN